MMGEAARPLRALWALPQYVYLRRHNLMLPPFYKAAMTRLIVRLPDREGTRG